MSDRKKDLLTEAYPSNLHTVKSETDTDRAVKNFLTNKNPALKWLSHETSMVLSSRIACSRSGEISISVDRLPDPDQGLVYNEVKTHGNFFTVSLDHNKNFKFTDEPSRNSSFVFGNRVASTPPAESTLFGNHEVKVENCGKNIVIGDKIKLEKSKIEQAVNTAEQPQPKTGFVPRTKVAGRNAYEIRADILEMALDWVKHVDYANDHQDVLKVAKAFYDFVEHK